ncbi:hypothetical protein [Mycobacterium sp. 141]|uniref:hypothetical protein n=1 Tax=Mycobacterium sp. 141 TaxID=1120797 RepID=UPI000362359A|nr:hypothetical protein [Mycobacterium sp. 141]
MYVFSLYDDFVTAGSDSDATKLPGLPVSGVKDGGAELNLGTLAENGVDIAEEFALSFRAVIDKIDAGLRDRGFDTQLDLARHGISTILWCTGFAPDYRILPSHVLDENGVPLQQGGILGVIPGLYYAGLPDGNSLARAGIAAVADNGRFIARHIHIDTRCGPARGYP